MAHIGHHIGNSAKVKPAISVVQGAPVALGSLPLPPWSLTVSSSQSLTPSKGHLKGLRETIKCC